MYIYTEREINDLKTELYTAKLELRRMERQLTKANTENAVLAANLASATAWLSTYKHCYEQNLQKCEELTKANDALKRKNRDLAMGLKAIKATINALKRKEM